MVLLLSSAIHWQALERYAHTKKQKFDNLTVNFFKAYVPFTKDENTRDHNEIKKQNWKQNHQQHFIHWAKHSHFH